MAQKPDFAEAAVWIIYPAHLTDEEVLHANSALEAALPQGAPVVAALTAKAKRSHETP
jgi:hypothetical protein